MFAITEGTGNITTTTESSTVDETLKKGIKTSFLSLLYNKGTFVFFLAKILG